MFKVVVEVLVYIALMRMQNRGAKALKDEIMFPTTTTTPTLQLHATVLTLLGSICFGAVS
jgi:hypothetical protein